MSFGEADAAFSTHGCRLQVVSGGQTLKINISGGKATGVTFVTKGPDGKRHQGATQFSGQCDHMHASGHSVRGPGAHPLLLLLDAGVAAAYMANSPAGGMCTTHVCGCSMWPSSTSILSHNYSRLPAAQIQEATRCCWQALLS